MPTLYTLNPDGIILYGVAWCGDCRRAKQLLAEKSIQYTDIDIDQDTKAVEFVKSVNRGFRSVPTIVFPDGTSLTEPDSTTLAAKLEAYQQTA